jgi:transposase
MCLYARSLTPLEGRRIQSIIRRSKNRVMIRRAQVVLLSAQGMRGQEISRMTYLHTEYVRELIRRFNRDGLALFQERSRSGRPLLFNKELRAEIIEYALSPPRLLGRPFSRWSVAKLREYLIEKRIVKRIGLETVRRILKEEHISLQRTKTWKESNDPEFESKKNA